MLAIVVQAYLSTGIVVSKNRPVLFSSSHSNLIFRGASFFSTLKLQIIIPFSIAAIGKEVMEFLASVMMRTLSLPIGIWAEIISCWLLVGYCSIKFALNAGFIFFSGWLLSQIVIGMERQDKSVNTCAAK